MNYRSITDLNRTIVNNLHRVPRDVDIIIGIPRSGLLAANILALHLNLPLADVEGFKAGRVLSSGRRSNMTNRLFDLSEMRKALVFDDSINTGHSIEESRRALQSIDKKWELLFGAVYTNAKCRNIVDLYFEICSTPRVFEWNILHHPRMARACVDIDGVLCRDPTIDENDDGPKYDEFLRTVEPLNLPTVPIGQLVTCRLEKYRHATEEWLRRHGVIYSELIMMQYSTKEERIRAGSHGRFKGDVYRSTPNMLFIESSVKQAKEIARISGKWVFCIETREMIQPPLTQRTIQGVRATTRVTKYQLRRVLSRIGRQFRLW